VDFNKAKVMQDWTAWNCQQLGLPIPHLITFRHDACTCKHFAIDELGDHLHCCTQHAGATTGAHEQILTAVQRLFTLAGYKTDRKHVPHSRGLKKADLVVMDFGLAGIRDLIIDVSLRHEFHGACADHTRNGEASHADSNGALDAAVKAKLDSYQHDYNERNFFFLPAVMTTSGRISGDFLRLLYCPTAKHTTTSHAWASSTPPPRPSNSVVARTSTTTVQSSGSHAPRPPP
jgi:hypothetical protein